MSDDERPFSDDDFDDAWHLTRELVTERPCWWWCSFTDRTVSGEIPLGMHLMGGPSFLGVVVAFGDDDDVATTIRDLHCHPGSDAELWHIPIPTEHLPPEHYRNRLLSFLDLHDAGLA